MAQQQSTKALSIRLPFEQLEDLEIFAFVDRCSLAEEIRQAITNHIEARRTDAAYLTHLQDGVDKLQRFIRSAPNGQARPGHRG